METLNKIHRFGILGGGQLALMLAQELKNLGFKPLILGETLQAPAVLDHSGSVIGSVNDSEVLQSFFSQVDQVTFENEFVDCELLGKLGSVFNVEFLPSLNAISQLQDKLSQKKILDRLQIPTAEYEVFDQSKDYFSDPIFQNGVVLKWSKMGYDGKGVLLLDDKKQMQNSTRMHDFLEQAKNKNSTVFVEKKIKFKRELACIATRSKMDEFVAYPVVVSEQESGICKRVFGPATSFGISIEKEKSVHQYMKKIADEVEFVGTFAVEFFEDFDGNLLVNEIAPRVHNSGHYTQAACITNQFENHWRAILGMPLGSGKTHSAFAMLNLLGPSGIQIQIQQTHRNDIYPVPGPRTKLHWYHKQQISPGRKLGHLNGVAGSHEEVQSLLKEMSQIETDWIKKLNSLNLNRKEK